MLLAWLEIVGGLSLGFGGCMASLATEASLAGVGAIFSLLIGLGGVALPGVLLFDRHPRRWVAQVLPAAIGLWLLAAWASSLSTP